MIKIDDSGGAVAFGKSLEDKIVRLNNLRHADKAARKAVLRRLRGINFKVTNRASHLIVDAGRIELGSYAPGYFKLLSLDGERLGEIYAAWVVTGSTNG